MNREDEQINDVFGSNDPIHELNDDGPGDTPLTNSESDHLSDSIDSSNDNDLSSDDTPLFDDPSGDADASTLDDLSTDDDSTSDSIDSSNDNDLSSDDPPLFDDPSGDADASTLDDSSTHDHSSLFDDALMAAAFSTNDEDETTEDSPSDDVAAFDAPVLDTVLEDDDDLELDDNTSQYDTSPDHTSFMDDDSDFDVDDTLFDDPTPSVQVSSLEFDSPSPMVGTNPAYGKNLFKNIKVDVSIELGRATISLKNLYELKEGSIIELSRLVGEPLDLLINDQVIAHGEVAVVDNHYAVRITKINELDTIQ